MLEFHTLDVFTDRAFAGNPLAVVLGADALDPAQMQVIAREFNLSETIFVQTPQDASHTARVRIFFPTAEIPFAGHPTIGCAILLAETLHAGDFDCVITLEEQAGLVPVTVRRTAGGTVAELTAPVVPYAVARDIPAGLIGQALGLAAADIGFGAHEPGVHEGGPAFLYVPVADRGALGRARPQEPAWSALMAAAGVDCAYLYTPGQGADFQARMFSPTAGIPEDPATGSASAVLASQLRACGVLPQGTARFTLAQGLEMGRPSHIRLTVDSGAAITAVRVAGQAVRVSHGRIRAPELGA
jgi:trans-2,3-dihydro-3-hydroxyanthranilate isomerase